eukprot:GHVL01013221.1.p1 GENE.GHVL01013221.1~~GHVL01013221.1.p1  ORF type:complete len:192 (+),score=42.84 GHVL01013221.1:134-709(+)
MSNSIDTLTSCLNLSRRLPPQDIEKTLVALVTLQPALDDELSQRVSRPLTTCFDEDAQMWFIESDYNNDGKLFRSPWTSKYFSSQKDSKETASAQAYQPVDYLRALETQLNAIFDAYRSSYYGGGVSSVYLWNLGGETSGFGGAFLVHKENNDVGQVTKGAWVTIYIYIYVYIYIYHSNHIHVCIYINSPL